MSKLKEWEHISFAHFRYDILLPLVNASLKIVAKHRWVCIQKTRRYSRKFVSTIEEICTYDSRNLYVRFEKIVRTFLQRCTYDSAKT
jgi:hypothetical protein